MYAIRSYYAAGNLEAMKIARNESWRREKLLELAAYLREHLRKLGLDTMETESQIIPVVCAGNDKALELSQDLYRRGIVVPAIRKPTA